MRVNGKKSESVTSLNLSVLILISVLLWMTNNTALAQTRIAILDFELKDLTLAPGIPAEVKRTASIKSLLEAELRSAGYQIIDIDFLSQTKAQAGIGYLFAHHDVAADLGRKFAADYVLVGRLHKPSFLFAYIMGHLIRVRDGKLIGNYISEAKGPTKKLTLKTVQSLAVKIDKRLDNNYTPPPPSH